MNSMVYVSKWLKQCIYLCTRYVFIKGRKASVVACYKEMADDRLIDLIPPIVDYIPKHLCAI
jgi:hypothetical protein